MEIAQENLYMYKRLRDKQSSYDINKLLKDYSKNQYYKQNACRYPSIDFFKEINEEKNFNKKNNIKVWKTENNYFPTLAKTTTSKFKSNCYSNKIVRMKTCEGFPNLKNRKNKGKKKKFKDFNFKDLRKLKEKKIHSLEKEKTKNRNDIKDNEDDKNIDKSKTIKNTEENQKLNKNNNSKNEKDKNKNEKKDKNKDYKHHSENDSSSSNEENTESENEEQSDTNESAKDKDK